MSSERSTCSSSHLHTGLTIPNRKLIHKVRHLLDSQSVRNGGPWRPLRGASIVAARPLLGPASPSENITTRTGTRRFESFLKNISQCDSLLDARRLRNDIVAELRRTRELIGMDANICEHSFHSCFMIRESPRRGHDQRRARR